MRFERSSQYGAEPTLLLVPHDNPNLTEPDKLRLSVCLAIAETQAVDGEVGKMTISGGQFAVGRFDILPEQVSQAWTMLVGKWLVGSGYQPDDRRCYERIVKSPETPPVGRIVLEICVPVRPL